MNMKRKIAVVVTSRASYARIKTVLKSIREHPELELFLIGAASLVLSKFGNAAEVMEKDGFTIHEKVYMIIEGENPTTMAKSVGIGVMELATIFDNYKPDIVISIADRFETISTAIAASYLNIPVAHVQGGEISGSIDEKVRHAVTKLSSLHFVSNQQAAKRVRLMGEDESSIFITGCPSIDLAAKVKNNFSYMNTEYLYSHYFGTSGRVDIDKDFLIVMQHPVTTEFKDAYTQMQETLAAVYEMKIPAIVLWPNIDAGSDMTSKAIRILREKYHPENFHFFLNLSAEDFLAVLMKARCIVGNSSVGIRECSYLGVPTVNIGNRQQGRDRAENVIDVGHSSQEIIQAVQKHLKKGGRYESSALYGDGNAGKKIADILSTVKLCIEKRFKE
ncbi:MAG: UDP-N-acetylglucosamine 2-epimerase (hydrolyzing) [Candidatus Aureabacteria bacterium]|nr:UDP-N-acetylglucosamine 2-epimerase (hydrolyzing) [Candidatus Auribacterota bacterium]